MHRGHSQNWLREPGTGGLMVWYLSHASKSEGTRVWSSFSQNVERHSGIKLWPPPADLRDLILLEARQGQWSYLTAQEDLISKRQEVGSQGKSWDDHPGIHPPCQDKADMKTSVAVALPRSHKVLQRRSPLSTRDRRVTMHSMNRIRHFCPLASPPFLPPLPPTHFDSGRSELVSASRVVECKHTPKAGKWEKL